MSSVFLSHSHADKAFVRRLAADLRRAGVRIWLDEAELQLGDSLIDKIREGIDQMEYVAAVLSETSVKSGWVKRELDVAMNQEIEGRRVKVLPLLLDGCDLPGFLKGKLYADFRPEADYDTALSLLLRKLGVESAAAPSDAKSLFTLLNAAVVSGDQDRFRRALMGFMLLPDGATIGLVADVLGSIAVWRERHATLPAEDLMYDTVVDAFSEAGPAAIAAVTYLLAMHRYFPRPVRRVAADVASPILGNRLAGNLVLYSFDGYGNTDDAQGVCLDRGAPLAFRIASCMTLGLAAHDPAAKALNEAAARCGDEAEDLQKAVYAGLNALSQRSAPSQILDGLAGLMADRRVTEEVRILAARRFLEISPDPETEWRHASAEWREAMCAAATEARALLAQSGGG